MSSQRGRNCIPFATHAIQIFLESKCSITSCILPDPDTFAFDIAHRSSVVVRFLLPVPLRGGPAQRVIRTRPGPQSGLVVTANPFHERFARDERLRAGQARAGEATGDKACDIKMKNPPSPYQNEICDADLWPQIIFVLHIGS